jgi:hypothetical protein
VVRCSVPKLVLGISNRRFRQLEHSRNGVGMRAGSISIEWSPIRTSIHRYLVCLSISSLLTSPFTGTKR